MNKVILIGNVGQDPELRHTNEGTSVANFTMATNERWTNSEGESQQRTEWHRIVVWRKQAETVAEYVKKGRLVAVEGQLRTRDWEDKEGNKRYTTEIHAQRVQFLGRRTEGEPEGEPEAGEE